MSFFKILFPNEDYNSIYEIDYNKLYEKGVRAIIFDIDNTLVMHGVKADKKIKAFFDKLRSLNINTCLLSNNKKKRVEPFAQDVGSLFIENAKKPSIKNYLKALELMNVKKEETIFIGDQLFTDILGAKRAGIYAILVKPIDKKEEIQIVIKRFFENIVLLSYKKGKGK